MHITFKQFVENLNKIPGLMLQCTNGDLLTPNEFLSTVDPDESTSGFRGIILIKEDL